MEAVSKQLQEKQSQIENLEKKMKFVVQDNMNKSEGFKNVIHELEDETFNLKAHVKSLSDELLKVKYDYTISSGNLKLHFFSFFREINIILY